MKEITERISKAQDLFREKLIAMADTGGLTRERYQRYLTMQYHIAKGVQVPFYRVASHASMGHRKKLREWLVNFAHEEEFHYAIAEGDLKKLNMPLLEMPFDVKLWWLFFDSIIDHRPLIRLGATCIMENIIGKSSDVVQKFLATSSFLKPENTRFLIIHQHGPNLDHGNQIVEALTQAELSKEELDDVFYGEEVATTICLRLATWVATGEVAR